MKIQLVFCFLLAATFASAQNTLLPGHEFYLKQMGAAKDSVYKEAMAHYNQFIAKYPDSVRVRLEQCRLMQHAYYDAYEEYNPLEEEAEACARNLVKDFADVPEVRLYAMDYIYGDSAITYLQELERLAGEQPARWQHHLWNVYQLMAQRQEYNDNNLEVLHYASMAMEENDTLDLTIQKARAEQALSRNDDAIKTLLSKVDSSQAGYYYNQKGKMLLELGEPERAFEILKMASRDTSNWEDLESLAQAMIDNGVPEAARDYLVKNRDRNTWNKTPSLAKLLEYDLKYKQDSAGASYDRYVNDNFWNDGLGVYRLRVLVADPGHHWTWSDAGRLLVLLAVVVCILLLPYLWILPIHYIGTWLRSRGRQFDLSPFRWTMTDFWIVSSLWLMASLIAGLFFNYRGIMSYFDDSISIDTVLPVNIVSANLFLCFTLACLAFTMGFVRRSDWSLILPAPTKWVSAIGTGIGLAIVLRLVVAIYVLMLKGANFNPAALLTVNDDILSLNQFYHPLLGFLLVAVVVPFYEEVIFRGIVLSALERQLPFMFANILQSGTFAMLHEDWTMLPFFFAFGMVAGYFRKRTNNLSIGIVMHIVNNAIAFIATTALH